MLLFTVVMLLSMRITGGKGTGMAIGRRKSPCEVLKQTLTDEFNRNLVETYAKNSEYNDLE